MEDKTVKPDVNETPDVPEVKEDRPEINYQAELARKNARIAELEAERLSKVDQPIKRDANDISTWTDQELKMLRNSNDPSVAAYKEQADDLLLDRKIKQIQAKEYENRRREEAKDKLAAEHPEALDPSSEFSMQVEKVMKEYDLSRTPAGRLVAAKIVAAEGKNSERLGKNKEADRVARVKGNMVDGDRPKPTDVSNPNKGKELKDKLMDTRNPDNQVDAISQILKDRGMTQKDFFKK